MRPDAVVMLVRVITGATFTAQWSRTAWSRMFVAAIVRVVFVMVVLNSTDRLIGGMVMIANVRRRSGATAHEVLSNERNEHHQ
jgi:hypothetical protein